MTKLIPLDAAIAAIECAWTHTGALETIRAIPSIGPAAIREAALKEAAKAVDALPDAESPDVNIGVAKAHAAILALIGKANSMIGEKK